MAATLTVYDEGPSSTPSLASPPPPPVLDPHANDLPRDEPGFKALGRKSVAAFGADLQETRLSQYGFDSLLYDPHRKINNRTETFNARHRRYYDENRWYNSHINAIVESLVEFGLELATDDEAKKELWKAWRRATGFDKIWMAMLKTKYALGNAYAAIVPAQDLGIKDPAAQGWGLQVLTTEFCYNVGDESGQLKAFYHHRTSAGVWMTFANMQLPTKSQGPWIMPEDMFYLSYDHLGNDLYARPLASTAGEAFDDMTVLQAMRNALAKNSAYGFMHIDVDTSHVAGGNSSTKGLNLKQEYFDGVMDLLQNVELYDALTGKMEVANRFGTQSFWDAEKKQKMGLVTVKEIDNHADFPGLVAVIDQLERNLSMVLRVPQAFMGAEGSNRAESVTQYLAYSQFLDAQIIPDYHEIETKLFPLIGLEGETLTHDSRVPSQELIQAQIAQIIAGIACLRDDEKRPLIGTALNTELTGEAPPPMSPILPAGSSDLKAEGNLPGSAQDSNQAREGAKLSASADLNYENPGDFVDGALKSRRSAKFGKAPDALSPQEKAFRTKWDFKQTQLLAKMRLAFDELMMRLADQFLAEAGVGTAKMAKVDPEEIKRLAKLKADREAFLNLLNEHDRLIYNASKSEIGALAGLPSDFEFKDTTGLKKLLAVNELAADRAISDVGAQARQVLVDAVASGQSVDDAADAVRKTFDDYDTDRLVRTELTRAGNAGTLDAYRNIPAYQQVRWMTSMDSLVDPVCRALEAQYADGISIDQADALGIPPEHPNCRCRWVPVSEWKFVTGGST